MHSDHDSAEFLRGVAWALVSLAMIVLLCLVVTVARAEEPSEFPAPDSIPLRARQCELPECSIVFAPDVVRMAELYDKARARVIELQAELARLREIKGCAKLEVTEPPKHFVPKKERDS